MQRVDYIILGTGASGLQLAYRMALDSFFDTKHILIIDKDDNKGNDRTWSYWEKGKGEWDDITHKTWDTIFFGSAWLSKTVNISPYRYKMIQSEAYYKKLWNTITTKSNIIFQQADVLDVIETKTGVKVLTSQGEFLSSKVFNSVLLNSNYKTQTKYPVLQQHFVGWFIKTKTQSFDDSVARFMDFNIPQNGNTRFMYVLPTSTTEALFEYTLFSKDLLPKSEYEAAIVDYLSNMGIGDYTITETEMGSIPMTSYKFHNDNTKHVLHIGTAGGWTKASTGYTFMNVTKKTKQLVAFLKHSEDMSQFAKRNKFWFYDLLMLDVLAKDNAGGAKLFSGLFKNAKTLTILRFLDEDTTFHEDLKIMISVPQLKFSKALFQRLFSFW